MTTSPSTQAPALVLVHCTGMSDSALEHRLTQVVATLPDDVEVVATIHRPHRRTHSRAGRVRLQLVTDGGHGIVDRAVSAGRFVVTVPAGLAVRSGWFEAARLRSEGTTDIGVVVLDGQGLFVFPAGVGTVAAERVEWPSLPGVGPLLSSTGRARLGAVLIVKDEQEALPGCLAALHGVVDEVVVYDTGSSDRTVEIARASGAVVIRGYWDDDFGAARNRALACATTEWVLSVDADEVVECVAADLRDWLDASVATAAMVPQVSTSWAGAQSGFEIRVTRLFRRRLARWEGSLHEAVIPIDEQEWVLSPAPAPLRLMHSGFREALAAERSKGHRNTSIARAALDRAEPGSADWMTAVAHHGRSLAMDERYDEALEQLSVLLGHDVPPVVLIPAARVVAQLLTSDANRAQEALPWLDRLTAAGEAPGQLALWRSRVALCDGDWWEAADLLVGFDTLDANGGVDLWGRPFDITLTTTAMAEIDILLGMPQEALRRMKAVLHAAPDRVKIDVLVKATLAAGFTLHDLAREAPRAFHDRSLRDVLTQTPDIALPWFDALSVELPGDHRPIVAASVAAARTGITEALEWSVRAREAGCSDVCALRMLAEDEALPAEARLLAWAVLLHGFKEVDAIDGVMATVELVDGPGRCAALKSLQFVVPGTLDLTAVDQHASHA